MSVWSTEMVVMIRHLINDLGCPPTYADERLQELVIINAQTVQQEVSFQNVYQFNLGALTITPDPGSAGFRDEAFMWLVTIKCCCMLARSELRSFSSNAFTLKDYNWISIDGTNVVKGKQAMAEMFCKDYEDARFLFQLATRPSGQGVFGPFAVITPGYFGQGGGFSYYTPRERPLFT